MVDEHFTALLGELDRTPEDVRGIGIGVPGPVAFHKGQPVKPPIMPGWNGFPIPRWFAGRYDAPVLVDNDVNIMALGEHWANWRETEHLMFVKVGTGIGCGIVAGRAIHRGAQGAAGDIGHIRLAGHEDVVCHCGNLGCVEAVAGGGALARRLNEAGIEAHDSRDVVRLVRADDASAVRMVREAGRYLGEVLASCVNFFNPGVIVIGGDVGEAPELLAGVREVTIQRSLPLATGELAIVASRLGDRAGVVGAAIMVVEHVLAPDVVDRVVQAGAAGIEPARPAVTLFTGQWADLPLEELAGQVRRRGASTGSSSRAGAITSTSRRRSPTPPTRPASASCSRATGCAAGRSATTSSARRCPTRSTPATRPCCRPRCGATATPRACRSAPPSG